MLEATFRSDLQQIEAVMRVKDVRKVVLAYSGGLDTKLVLKWLQTTGVVNRPGFAGGSHP